MYVCMYIAVKTESVEFIYVDEHGAIKFLVIIKEMQFARRIDCKQASSVVDNSAAIRSVQTYAPETVSI